MGARPFLDPRTPVSTQTLTVEQVAASNAAVTLVLKVRPGSDNAPLQFWEVVCANPLRYRLTPGEVHGYLNLLEDHPLVWEHTDPTQTLALLGKPDNALATVAALIERHHAVAQGWMPIERYLPLSQNYYGGLSGLLAGGHGFVATGPDRLVRAYADVLQAHGSRTKIEPALFPLLATMPCAPSSSTVTSSSDASFRPDCWVRTRRQLSRSSASSP